MTGKATQYCVQYRRPKGFFWQTVAIYEDELDAIQRIEDEEREEYYLVTRCWLEKAGQYRMRKKKGSLFKPRVKGGSR